MSFNTVFAPLPILDVHEHHFPRVFLNREVGLADILRDSYAGWTQARPYPLPTDEEDSRRGGTALPDDSPEALQHHFLDHAGSNHFVRNLLGGLRDLYVLGEDVSAENWEELDRRIRKQRKDPEWPHEVMHRAGVTQIITDPYEDPMLDPRKALGRNYRAVMRINALAMSWHPGGRDHNGNSAFDFAQRLCVKLNTFADFEHLLEHAVDTMVERGHVALKNALAYDRSIDFDNPDPDLARQAWGNIDASPEQRKAFGDFVVDRLCQLAGERDIPVQMHLGTALIGGSHPLKAEGLIARHPRTRFLLMHLAYPWSADLLGMAFVHRNIWLDLTWSWLLSPSHFKRALHEAIEVLPDESRLMLGGDNWHAEESYATLQAARRLIGEVLKEKVAAGYFAEGDAHRLAKKILHANAQDFFRLTNHPIN